MLEEECIAGQAKQTPDYMRRAEKAMGVLDCCYKQVEELRCMLSPIIRLEVEKKEEARLEKSREAAGTPLAECFDAIAKQADAISCAIRDLARSITL